MTNLISEKFGFILKGPMFIHVLNQRFIGTSPALTRNAKRAYYFTACIRVVVSVCGHSGLWPLRFVAVSVCSRYDLLPRLTQGMNYCKDNQLWKLKYPCKISKLPPNLRSRSDIFHNLINGSTWWKRSITSKNNVYPPPPPPPPTHTHTHIHTTHTHTHHTHTHQPPTHPPPKK